MSTPRVCAAAARDPTDAAEPRCASASRGARTVALAARRTHAGRIAAVPELQLPGLPQVAVDTRSAAIAAEAMRRSTTPLPDAAASILSGLPR